MPLNGLKNHSSERRVNIQGRIRNRIRNFLKSDRIRNFEKSDSDP
jgi:hypothetical protein